MRKILVVIFSVLLPLTVVWAAGDQNPANQQQEEWQPEYGRDGRIINYPPAVAPYGLEFRGGNNIPIITTTENKLFEDFEAPTGWNGANPPTGWAIVDSGVAPLWANQDWHWRFNYDWGGNMAEISTQNYEDNDDWLISPPADFSTATVCSLMYMHQYDWPWTPDIDTAYVMVTDDSGSTWTEVAHYTGQSYGGWNYPDTQRVDITAFAAGKGAVQVGFYYSKTAYNAYGGTWKVDDVELTADAVALVSEDFEGSWGPMGDNPPTGWTILDTNYPSPWDENDWFQYNDYDFGNIARMNVYPTETQNEWLISPSMDMSAGYDQILLFFNQRYDNSDPSDTGRVYISTDNWATKVQAAIYTTDQAGWGEMVSETLDITTLVDGYADVQVAFNFVNETGYGTWYLDLVIVDALTFLNDDVSTLAINSPLMGISGYDHLVSTQVYNNGLNTNSFDDHTEIIKLNKAYYLQEGFSNPAGWTGANPPTGWAVIDSGDGTPGWDDSDWHQYNVWDLGDIAKMASWNPAENANDWLISPTMDLSGAANVHLTFAQKYWHYGAATDTAFVLGTNDGWATTEVLATYVTEQGTGSVPSTPSFDITSWAAGQSSVNIAFKYVGNNGGDWYLDDVTVYEDLSPTTLYSSSEYVASLASTETREVPYWTKWSSPTAGDYTVKSWTGLAGDEDPSNDTTSIDITVHEHYEHGGPDNHMYEWNTNKDGGTGGLYDWIDISGIGTPVNWDMGSGHDRHTSSIPLGFTINHYGNDYDAIYLDENGVASFDSIAWSISYNGHIPTGEWGTKNILAILHQNLSGVDNGAAYYYTNSVDTFIVTYDNWDYEADHDQRIDMQMILTTGLNSGVIKMQYRETGPIVYLDHTIGIGSGDGLDGLEFSYEQDIMGNIPMAGLAVTFRVPVYDNDLKAEGYIDPSAAGLTGDPFTPLVVFKNVGHNDQTNVPVRLTIEPGTYEETGNIGSLLSGLSTVVPFASFTPTAGGSYTLTAISELVSDNNPVNDTLVLNFTAYDQIVDFEADNGGLIGDGDWEWGIPTYGPSGAFSGDNCWATNLSGDYTTGGAIHSLEFQLAVGSTAPNLGIASWYSIGGNGWSGSNLSVSTDGGTTWEAVSPDRGYDDNAKSSNPLNPDSVFTGDNGDWEYNNFDLSAYAGTTVMARFALGVEQGTWLYLPGWYIDDLGLGDCAMVAPEIDVTPASIEGTAAVGGSTSETISVNNLGDGTLYFNASAEVGTGLALNSLYSNGQDIPITLDVELANENFDDGLLPTGWSIYDENIDGATWMAHSASLCPQTIPNMTTDWMICDGSCYPYWYMNEDLFTAYYDCDGNPYITVSFNMDFQYWDTWWAYPSVFSVRNGSAGAWIEVETYSVTTTGYMEYDLSGYSLGALDSVQFKYHYNNGGAMNAGYLAVDDFILSAGAAPWISIDIFGGEIPSGGAGVDIEVTMSAADLELGVYNGSVIIGSNDADESDITIPVTFVVSAVGGIAGTVTENDDTTPIEGVEVSAVGMTLADTTDVSGQYSFADIFVGTYDLLFSKEGYVDTTVTDVVVEDGLVTTVDVSMRLAGCDYVMGDVNGVGGYDGLDIVFGVAFFKDGPAPVCPDCPLCPDFPYCGTVNGDCAYDGLDIVYGVAFFKDGPAPIPCDDCVQVGSGITSEIHLLEVPTVIKNKTKISEGARR